MLNPHHRLVALVIAALAGLAGATGVLASLHHVRRDALAESHFARGRALAGSGRPQEAVEEYRAALSVRRGQFDIERALALTLLSIGRLSEAESYLRDLLDRDPASGPLNRGLARIYARRGRVPEARAAYQRAVYGEWPGESNERLDTRFELIDYLTTVKMHEEMLPELLRLKAELPPARTADARRVAALLVEAGAPDRAIELLRAASAEAPRDVELLAHLADVQAAATRSEEASVTLRRALVLAPGREDLIERAAVIDRVRSLDPTLPRLRLVTRTRRARLVLAAVYAHTRGCLEASAGAQPLLDDTARRLRLRARTDAEAAETDLALAVRLWTSAPDCHGDTPEGRALTQVLDRVAGVDRDAS
jgi:tetratricopeptide (TPR) repeat protein